MDDLQGIVRFTFHAGMVEEFKRLSAECVEIVRSKDVGTLQTTPTSTTTSPRRIVLERFRDSDALVLHGQNMAPVMEAIMATGTVSGELLGAPNEQLRTQLAGSPVGVLAVPVAAADETCKVAQARARIAGSAGSSRRGCAAPVGGCDDDEAGAVQRQPESDDSHRVSAGGRQGRCDRRCVPGIRRWYVGDWCCERCRRGRRRSLGTGPPQPSTSSRVERESVTRR